MTGKRVLVTGASGFIGSWLCRRLSDAGAIVHGTTRKEADLTSTDQLRRLLATVNPEIVFNAAAYGVDRAEQDSELHQQLNIDLPARLCGLLPASARLIHIGSGAEYGNPAGELSEDTPPRPTTLYGSTKLAGTRKIIEARGRVHGLIGRLFTVYGPGEHPGRLLPSLIQAARTGQPVSLTGGQQERDFTYVEDAVEGLIRLALSPAAPGTAVNIATGKLTSVRKFAEAAADVLGFEPGVLRFGNLPARTNEIIHGPVSTNRMYEMTHWTPRTGIREGIRRTAEAEAYACAAEVTR